MPGYGPSPVKAVRLKKAKFTPGVGVIEQITFAGEHGNHATVRIRHGPPPGPKIEYQPCSELQLTMGDAQGLRLGQRVRVTVEPA